FPGWHIECSVMGMKYLGETFDLHAGGEDLIFPHHECEIAQSVSLTGRQFANFWVHTRFLQVEGEKMSKSRGNFFTARQLIDPEPKGRGVHPLALRLALISGQYRKPFNFTMKTLRDSVRLRERFVAVRDRALQASDSGAVGPDRVGDRLSDIYERTLDAMLDDLNTPLAIATSLEGVKLINGMGDSLNRDSARAACDWINRTNDLLGFIVREDDLEEGPGITDPLERRVEALLAERAEARKTRDFARADAIRDELDAMKIEVMDTPGGTTWKRKTDL
ncbi:MAG: CysS/YqeB C-terminal domain-containing protein, partial [Bacteroidota bacterium]